MRPSTFGQQKHGTRGRYVQGCRCWGCRKSNRDYYHARRARELVALAELEIGAPMLEREVVRTKLDPRSGRMVVHRFKRPCPGLQRNEAESTGCPFGAYLRKDSQRVCSRCRAETVADYLVDAGRARRRVRWLSRKGIGRDAVADAAGVARSVVSAISDGKKRTIRLSTERKILEVDTGAVADGANVDAEPTRTLLAKLLEEGFTKTELARRLGSRAATPALQIGQRDKVLASTAQRVAKFYRAIMAEAEP